MKEVLYEQKHPSKNRIALLKQAEKIESKGEGKTIYYISSSG